MHGGHCSKIARTHCDMHAELQHAHAGSHPRVAAQLLGRRCDRLGVTNHHALPCGRDGIVLGGFWAWWLWRWLRLRRWRRLARGRIRCWFLRNRGILCHRLCLPFGKSAEACKSAHVCSVVDFETGGSDPWCSG